MLINLGQDLRRWKVEAYRPEGAEPIPVSLSKREALRLLWRQPVIWATVLHRAGHWCAVHGVRVMPSLLERLNLVLFGIQISARTHIGPGLYIAHPAGMVIVASRIGANASFIHACTLGMRDEHAFPTLGDAVFVGAGARVLGGVTLGDGARVGANAVVIRDVPPRATVVGVPGRILGADEPAPPEA